MISCRSHCLNFLFEEWVASIRLPPTTLSRLIFLTVIKPVALSYSCIYLAGLHSGIYILCWVSSKLTHCLTTIIHRFSSHYYQSVCPFQFNPRTSATIAGISVTCYCSYCGRISVHPKSCDTAENAKK
jgi:hypothetical protein